MKELSEKFQSSITRIVHDGDPAFSIAVPTVNFRLIGLNRIILKLDLLAMYNTRAKLPTNSQPAEFSFVFSCYQGVDCSGETEALNYTVVGKPSSVIPFECSSKTQNLIIWETASLMWLTVSIEDEKFCNLDFCFVQSYR